MYFIVTSALLRKYLQEKPQWVFQDKSKIPGNCLQPNRIEIIIRENTIFTNLNGLIPFIGAQKVAVPHLTPSSKKNHEPSAYNFVSGTPFWTSSSLRSLFLFLLFFCFAFCITLQISNNCCLTHRD